MLRDKFWVSLDPGLSGTGVTVWKGSVIWFTENFVFQGFDDWDQNAGVMYGRIRDGIFEKYPICFYCYELPAFIERARMQNRKQDIVKLTMFAGMLHGLALGTLEESANNREMIAPIRILDWKGGVEKKMMNDRTKACLLRNPHHVPLGYVPPRTTHELDAIGIGLWVMGTAQ